jgi:hypothetical protein
MAVVVVIALALWVRVEPLPVDAAPFGLPLQQQAPTNAYSSCCALE